MLRYSAHLPLGAIGAEGQQRIQQAHLALVGIGGIGCAVAQYLVSCGIGKLTLCDFDTVSESNLARQILYRREDVGRLKTEAAIDYLHELNPQTRLQSIDRRMNDEEMSALFPTCELVVDASDNYGTRLSANRNCIEHKVPWIMASCIRMEGQIMLLRPDLPANACYRCAYGIAPDTLEDCPGAGIFAPVAGICGTSAAHFALAHLAGHKVPSGLHLFDASHWQWQPLKIGKNSNCRDCS